MRKTLAIRHYVIGQMYRAGGSSMQLMSARDMARHFGIACSTVSIALKELADEGYIFSRHGVGNFTNPLRMPVDLERPMPPLAGLMAGDGRFYYKSAHFWQTYRSLGDALFNAGFNLRDIELSGPVDAEGASEVQDNKIDALIWLGAYDQQDFAAKLSASGMPFVTDSPYLKGVNSVAPDRADSMRDVLAHAEKSGKRAILLYLPPEVARSSEKSLLELAKASGAKLSVDTVDPTRFPHEKALRDCFARRGEVLAVVEDSRSSENFLSRYAKASGAQVELHLNNSTTLNGKPAKRFCGVRFAEAIVARLKDIMEGDKSVKRLLAPMDVLPQGP